MKCFCLPPLRVIVGVVVGAVLIADALLVLTLFWLLIQLIGWY